MGIEVTIKEDDFDNLLELMKANIETLVHEAAKEVAEDAAGAVAVRSGADKASIYVSSHKGSTYADAVASAQSDNPKGEILPEETPSQEGEAIVGVAEDYGIFVEMGTSHMPARPYLTPALEGKRSQIVDKLAQGLFDE